MAKTQCLRAAQNNLERHQMGFEGEAIGYDVVKKLGYKKVTLTKHKDPFDIVTKDTAWEVKTCAADAKDIKMTVKTAQREKKIEWAKANGKEPKSMLIVVNDKTDVYIRDGIGAFRPTNMTKLGSYGK